MSDKEIAYDLRLEEKLDEILLKIWINEELQIQPRQFHSSIRKNSTKFVKTG